MKRKPDASLSIFQYMSSLLWHTHSHTHTKYKIFVYELNAKRIWTKNAYSYWNLRIFQPYEFRQKTVFASVRLQYNFSFVKRADNSQSLEFRSHYKIRWRQRVIGGAYDYGYKLYYINYDPFTANGIRYYYFYVWLFIQFDNVMNNENTCNSKDQIMQTVQILHFAQNRRFFQNRLPLWIIPEIIWIKHAIFHPISSYCY